MVEIPKCGANNYPTILCWHNNTQGHERIANSTEGSRLVSKRIKTPQRASSVLHNQDLVIRAALLGPVVSVSLSCRNWCDLHNLA